MEVSGQRLCIFTKNIDIYDEDGNKGAEGGWYFETIGGSIYRFTRGGVEYTLMRTVNPVLETTYYRVKK